jgi:hypothetical protein
VGSTLATKKNLGIVKPLDHLKPVLGGHALACLEELFTFVAPLFHAGGLFLDRWDRVCRDVEGVLVETAELNSILSLTNAKVSREALPFEFLCEQFSFLENSRL